MQGSKGRLAGGPDLVAVGDEDRVAFGPVSPDRATRVGAPADVVDDPVDRGPLLRAVQREQLVPEAVERLGGGRRPGAGGGSRRHVGGGRRTVAGVIDA